MTEVRIRHSSGATLEGKPELVAGTGPSLVQEWLLEADATAYRAIVAFVDIDDGGVDRLRGDRSTLRRYAYVMCTIAGGEVGSDDRYGVRQPRWPVSGGGAWYPFVRDGGHLTDEYVAEKFRLNRVDAFQVARLIRAALGRKEE